MWRLEQGKHRCPVCNTFDWEWVDPDTGDPAPKWEVALATCNGCFARDELQDRVRQSNQRTTGQRIEFYRVNSGS